MARTPIGSPRCHPPAASDLVEDGVDGFPPFVLVEVARQHGSPPEPEGTGRFPDDSISSAMPRSRLAMEEDPSQRGEFAGFTLRPP
jgi:hypothetical protein